MTLRQNARHAKAMLGDTGAVARVAALATVYPLPSDPDDWAVGSLDADGEGSIFTTVFYGPSARQRAEEYAREKYSGFEVREAVAQ